MSKISEFYADDHDRLDAIFQQFVLTRADNPLKAREAFMEFKAGLNQHIVWEEELLFPQFEEKTGMTNGGPTQVMRLEHQGIQNHLNEIAAKLRLGLPTDQEEGAMLEVLSGHNQKEEMILYPALDNLLDDQERRHVFELMESTSSAA